MSNVHVLYGPPEKTEKGFDIKVETTANARPETVFSVLTDKDQLAALLGCEIEGEIKEGSPIKYIWQGNEDPTCNGICGGHVVAVEPPRRFAFSWGDENSPKRDLPWGSTLVEFLVEPAGKGSRIIIRHYSLPTEREAELHRKGWAEYADIMNRHWARMA